MRSKQMGRDGWSRFCTASMPSTTSSISPSSFPCSPWGQTNHLPPLQRWQRVGLVHQSAGSWGERRRKLEASGGGENQAGEEQQCWWGSATGRRLLLAGNPREGRVETSVAQRRRRSQIDHYRCPIPSAAVRFPAAAARSWLSPPDSRSSLSARARPCHGLTTPAHCRRRPRLRALTEGSLPAEHAAACMSSSAWSSFPAPVSTDVWLLSPSSPAHTHEKTRDPSTWHKKKSE